jgi:hypothetical protein
MKLTLVLTLLTLLVTATVGKPTKPRTFRLRADRKAPAPVNTFGFLDLRLGWYAAPGANYHAYIEPYGNRTEPGQEGWGKCHDATTPQDILYAHGQRSRHLMGDADAMVIGGFVPLTVRRCISCSAEIRRAIRYRH